MMEESSSGGKLVEVADIHDSDAALSSDPCYSVAELDMKLSAMGGICSNRRLRSLFVCGPFVLTHSIVLLVVMG